MRVKNPFTKVSYFSGKGWHGGLVGRLDSHDNKTPVKGICTDRQTNKQTQHMIPWMFML